MNYGSSLYWNAPQAIDSKLYSKTITYLILYYSILGGIDVGQMKSTRNIYCKCYKIRDVMLL